MNRQIIRLTYVALALVAVVAQAYEDAHLGRRLVGTFDRTLTVDPRAPGWTIHFFPANF